MSIEVKNLTRLYGTQKAVNNISFTVGKGEIVGFLGPNGAGKSTTMKMITGYLPPTSGEAWVSGTSVLEQPLEVKKKIGYLPELNPLYYDMYVREYLLFIAALHRVNQRRSAVDRVIDLVGLTAEAAKKIGQLSKGYKQRVGLAAALIHDPEVLILDEPTSGLDPNQIIEIREVIRRQGADKTVLFSSHILQEVEAICDRVIIINKGSVVADDQLSRLQQKDSDAHSVQVHFQEAVTEDLLRRMEAALSVTASAGNRYVIRTNKPEQVRKQILELALQQNLNIVSLQSERQKLEDIFRSLTQSNDQVQ